MTDKEVVAPATTTETPRQRAVAPMREVAKKAVEKAVATKSAKAERTKTAPLTVVPDITTGMPALVPDAEKPAAKKTTTAKGRKAPAKAPAKESPAKKAAASNATRAPVRRSSDSTDIPSDPSELQKLVKVTRDRRWRAGKRGDEQLVAQLTARLDRLAGANK